MSKNRLRMVPKDRHKQILDVAMYLAARDGFVELTRDTVAEAAGCAPGLISRYFRTMRGLKNSVMREAVDTRALGIIAEGLALKDAIALSAPQELKAEAAQSLH